MNEYYSVQMDPDFLEHHGVDGMRWGKRNGPPYPLDAQGKADLKEQKKAEKQELKETKKKVASNASNYTSEDKKRIAKNTAIATIIGGPLLGVTVGMMTGDKITTEKAKAIIENNKSMPISNISDDLKDRLDSDAISKLSDEDLKSKMNEKALASAKDPKNKNLENEASSYVNEYMKRKDAKAINQRQLSTLSKEELGKRLNSKKKEVNAAEKDLAETKKMAQSSGDYSAYNYKVEKYANLFDEYDNLKDMYNWK